MAERKEENKGQTDRLTWSTPWGRMEADQSVSGDLQDFLQTGSPGSEMGWQLAEAFILEGTSGLGEI
jgi:hypothetical protein